MSEKVYQLTKLKPRAVYNKDGTKVGEDGFAAELQPTLGVAISVHLPQSANLPITGEELTARFDAGEAVFCTIQGFSIKKCWPDYAAKAPKFIFAATGLEIVGKEVRSSEKQN